MSAIRFLLIFLIHIKFAASKDPVTYVSEIAILPPTNNQDFENIGISNSQLQGSTYFNVELNTLQNFANENPSEFAKLLNSNNQVIVPFRFSINDPSFKFFSINDEKSFIPFKDNFVTFECRVANCQQSGENYLIDILGANEQVSDITKITFSKTNPTGNENNPEDNSDNLISTSISFKVQYLFIPNKNQKFEVNLQPIDASSENTPGDDSGTNNKNDNENNNQPESISLKKLKKNLHEGEQPSVNLYEQAGITLIRNSNSEYSLNVDVILLYEFAKTDNFKQLFNIESNSPNPQTMVINLAFKYSSLEYSYQTDTYPFVNYNEASQDITFKKQLEIGQCVFENDIYKITLNDFSKAEENLYLFNKPSTNGNFDCLHLSNSVSLKVNYPSLSIKNLNVRPVGPSKGIAAVEGPEDFNYSKAYKDCGLEFNSKTQTISIDRIKFLNFINKQKATGEHDFEYLVRPDTQTVYFGLCFDSSVSAHYDYFAYYKQIEFSPVSDEYQSNPIFYIPVATFNKPEENPDEKYNDNIIFQNTNERVIRCIWRKNIATTENQEYEYITTESTIKVEFKSFTDVAPILRPEGPAGEDLSGENLETFDYSTFYKNAGITFNPTTKTIEVDRDTMQKYINVEDNLKKFLHFCQPDDGKNKILVGLYFSGQEYEDYTDVTKTTPTAVNFADLSFQKLSEATDPINYFEHKVIKYITIGDLIFYNDKYYIRQYEDKSFPLSYLYRKDITVNDKSTYEYKAIETTIYLKTKTQLALNLAEVASTSTGLTQNNGRLSVNVPSLRTYLNPKMENFNRNQDATLGIFNYHAENKQLTLDIPYQNLKYSNGEKQNDYSAINLGDTLLAFDTVYDFNGYSIRDGICYRSVVIGQMIFYADDSFYLQKINGNAEQINGLLLDPLNYMSGEWSVIIPPYNDIIDFVETCTNGQGNCTTCDKANVDCQTCASGFQVDSNGKCVEISQSGSNVEIKFETDTVTCNNGDCELDEKYDQYTVLEFDDNVKNVQIKEDMPANAYYPAKAGVTYKAADSKDVHLQFNQHNTETKLDLSSIKPENAKQTVKLNLIQTEATDNGNVLNIEGTAGGVKTVVLENTNSNQIKGQLTIKVPDSIQQVDIQTDVQLYHGGSIIIQNKQGKAVPVKVKLIETKPYSQISVKSDTTVQEKLTIPTTSAIQISQSLQFQSSAVLDFILSSETDKALITGKLGSHPSKITLSSASNPNANAQEENSYKTLVLISGNFNCSAFKEALPAKGKLIDPYKSKVCKVIEDKAKKLEQNADSNYKLILTSEDISDVDDGNGGPNDDKLSGGAIAGIVIACVVVVAAVVVVLVYFLVIKKNDDKSVGEQQDVEL